MVNKNVYYDYCEIVTKCARNEMNSHVQKKSDCQQNSAVGKKEKKKAPNSKLGTARFP